MKLYTFAATALLGAAVSAQFLDDERSRVEESGRAGEEEVTDYLATVPLDPCEDVTAEQIEEFDAKMKEQFGDDYQKKMKKFYKMAKKGGKGMDFGKGMGKRGMMMRRSMKGFGMDGDDMKPMAAMMRGKMMGKMMGKMRGKMMDKMRGKMGQKMMKLKMLKQMWKDAPEADKQAAKCMMYTKMQEKAQGKCKKLAELGNNVMEYYAENSEDFEPVSEADLMKVAEWGKAKIYECERMATCKTNIMPASKKCMMGFKKLSAKYTMINERAQDKFEDMEMPTNEDVGMCVRKTLNFMEGCKAQVMDEVDEKFDAEELPEEVMEGMKEVMMAMMKEKMEDKMEEMRQKKEQKRMEMELKANKRRGRRGKRGYRGKRGRYAKKSGRYGNKKQYNKKYYGYDKEDYQNKDDYNHQGYKDKDYDNYDDFKL